MKTKRNRVAALEAENANQKKLANALALEAEIRAALPMVSEYFESNGCKPDTKPRDDFTECQRKMLAAIIEFERDC